MLFATGWVLVRLTRKTYATLLAAFGAEAALNRVDDVDSSVAEADQELFDQLERFLVGREPPDLDWHFRRAMNNAAGLLQFTSSRNHRGVEPTAIEILSWLGTRGDGS